MHTHTDTGTHKYSHADTGTHMHAHTDTGTHKHTHADTGTHKHAHTDTGTRKHAHADTSTHKHVTLTQAHTSMHTDNRDTHACTCRHRHMHARTDTGRQKRGRCACQIWRTAAGNEQLTAPSAVGFSHFLSLVLVLCTSSFTWPGNRKTMLPLSDSTASRLPLFLFVCLFVCFKCS